MKKCLCKFIDIIKENKYFVIGFVLIMLYLFSDCLLNSYTVSFNNFNYSQTPFNSLGVETAGPWLSDVADSDYPLKFQVFYNEDGISFWDSDIALGTSINSLAEILYPGNIVFLLPFQVAILLKLVLELVTAFFSMYIFMKSIEVKKYAALITAVIYTFSSALIVWLGWPHSDVMALAPLLFWAVEKLVSTIKIKYMLFLSLIIYTMLMATMPTYVAYFMYLVGVYLVIYTCMKYWKSKRNILYVFFMFAIGVMLAVIMSIPYTIELINQVVGNGYASSREAYSEVELGTKYIRTFLFPYVRDGLSAHINESTLYVGILPLVILPLVLVNNKEKKRNLFFLIASIVAFCLIFTNAFEFIYKELPAVNTSLKFRVICLLMFTMSVLTGITLNDILENGDKYWSKKWLIAIQIVWSVAILYISTEEIYSTHLRELQKVTIIMTILLVGVIMLMKRKSRLIQMIIAMVVIIDSVGFAKDYLPYVDASVEVIPEATDSVEYMMENTKNEERILGIGNWNLFPNTNTYYGLNDIRVHGFVATNQDIQNYYKTIYSESYVSNTRVDFSEIDNYELLKYIGVKYVHSSALGNVVQVSGTSENRVALGAINSNSIVKEKVFIENNIASLQVLFATYGSIPSGKDNLNVSLLNEDGESVWEKCYSTSQLRDNAYLKMDLTGQELETGNYSLEMKFGDVGGDTITLWYSADGSNVFDYNGQSVIGNLIINAVYPVDEYDIVYQGKDGLEIGQLKEFADKVELIENVYVLSDEQEVLDTMSEKYMDNTMFVTEDSGITEYNVPLSKGESVEVIEYSDDYIKIECNTQCARYVSVNDYYSDDWCAYVNGEKVEIEKINYLLRAVKVEAGENIVIEMKYEPTQIYGYLACFGVGVVIWIILFVFRNKLQSIIDKKIIKEIE